MTFTPKPRKVLPMASATADHHVHGPEIRERFAAAMRRCPVLHGSAKLVARATGQTPRAASKQLDAENCVSVEALANLVRHSDEVLREFLTIAGREDVLMTQDERERRTREAIRILTGRAE
jgi:hypothetical protein